MDTVYSFREATEQNLRLAEKIDISGNYRPSEEEPYMNPRQVEYFRRKLVLWREQLLKESDETWNQLKEESIREIDIIDQGALELSMTLKLKTRDRSRKLIYKIDDALGRINNGTYGYCEQTGEEIGLRRLEARPIATLSIEAQEWHERMERRGRARMPYMINEKRKPSVPPMPPEDMY